MRIISFENNHYFVPAEVLDILVKVSSPVFTIFLLLTLTLFSIHPAKICVLTFLFLKHRHCVKMSVFGVILVRIFPHTDCIRTRITPNTYTFYAVGLSIASVYRSLPCLKTCYHTTLIIEKSLENRWSLSLQTLAVCSACGIFLRLIWHKCSLKLKE